MGAAVGNGSHSPAWICLVLAILAGCAGSAVPSSRELLQAAGRKEELGDFDAALKLAEAGEKASTDPESLTLFRLRKAEVLLLKGDILHVLPLLPAGLAPNSEAGCRVRMIRGWAEFRQGRIRGARKLLDEAYGCALAIRDQSLTGRIETWRAAVFTSEGDSGSAESSVRHALEIGRTNKDPFLEATALGNLGVMRLSASRFDEAITAMEESLRIGEKMGARSSQAINLLNLAYCHYQLGDLDRAIEMYSRARTMLASSGRLSSLQIALGNTGNVYFARQDYKTAQTYYNEAVQLARQVHDPAWEAVWSGNMAMVLIASGDYNAAETYNNQALALQATLPPSQAKRWTQMNLAGIAAARGEFPKAIAEYKNIAESEPHSPSQVLEAYSHLGRIYLGMHELAKAESAFQKTTVTIEQFREKLSKDDYKLTYLSSLIHFYQDYVEMLMSQGKQEKALRVVEASRARILSARLGSRETMRMPDAAAASGTTILAFWMAPHRSYVWVLQPGKVTALPLPGEEIITPLVEKHSKMIQNLRDPLESGSPLFDMLLGGASKLIPKNGRVIVMPDGVLTSLNFETLPVAHPTPHYWIQDVTLSLAPSLAVLGAQPKTAVPDRSVLLIGDPALPADSGPPLPFAAREIESIRQRVSASQPAIYTRAAATPEAYRQAGGFRLIHFASHATANRESPLDSAVLLSGSKLYVRDIVKVPLSADLVTVSACRSAGARTYGGEGLVGFAWAFLQSGARNVVAGLWDVNDASTAGLMGDLYSQLQQGQPVSEALRTAKLHMIQSAGAYRKPYYWAPFQVYTRTGSRPTSR